MTKTSLFLEPVDVWLFRDGRPFDFGSDHRAESIFPPFPSVIQGAIRSHQLVLQDVPLHSDRRTLQRKVLEVVGEPLREDGRATDLKGLRLRGPFLARYNNDVLTRYFPQPADAVTVDNEVHSLKPASAPEATPEDVKTSLGRGACLLGFRDPPHKGEGGLWLTEDNLLKYLKGKEVYGIPESELFQREERIGIAMDSQKNVTQRQMLYEVQFIRLTEKGIGLQVELEGYDWGKAPQGVLKIGGENHAASYKTIETPPFSFIPAKFPRRFKVYFATPAYFSAGWKPIAGWDHFFGSPVDLRAAAIGRAVSLGGYDLANDQHKPARRFVPAGSVYFFESKDGMTVQSDLVQNAMTEFGAEVGFGQYIISEEEW